ncbi:ABC transporter permease [Rhizobium sp. LEGMi135b]
MSLRIQRIYADGLILFAILGWWMTSASLPTGVVPSLYDIAFAASDLASSMDFWLNAASTMLRVLTAVLLATLIGGGIGILPRYLPAFRIIVDGVLVPFFASFPGIAWAILGTVWFGVGPTAVLVTQFLIVLPFALVNVAEGAKSVGQDEVEMGQSFTRSRLAVFWRIELPLLAPYLIAAVRISYGVCWKVSLIAELFGARAGIGFLMQLSQDNADVARIVALCLWIVAFVVVGEKLVLNPLTRFVERGQANA